MGALTGKKTVKNTAKIEEYAKRVLEAAKHGTSDEQTLFFLTTYQRYQTQLSILDALKEEIEETGPTVTKVYVKKRENVVVNPAITEYNRTATAANSTVATLIKIITALDGASLGGGVDDEL